VESEEFINGLFKDIELVEKEAKGKKQNVGNIQSALTIETILAAKLRTRTSPYKYSHSIIFNVTSCKMDEIVQVILVFFLIIFFL
jgi:hypothetical protein